MNYQRLKFENSSGAKLGARLDLPTSGEPIAYALFAHCFTCTKNLKAVSNITTALTERGIAVLRFDFTGLGESEGDFADTNFSSNVADLVKAAEFLADNYDAPQILVGHSLGGAAVLKAAASLPNVKAFATIGAPADPQHVEHLITSSREEIEEQGEAEVVLAGRPFTIKKQFLEDLEKHSMQTAIRELGRPLMIFHSPIDNTVGVDNAADIFLAAKHPKSFVSLDTADHLLSNPDDAQFVGAMLATWGMKYIEAAEPSQEAAVYDDATVVRTEQGYRTDIQAGKHNLVADEPVSLGGTDHGPNPYEYLLASLGSCTSITLRMYANRKKWPLESVTVRLKHSKIHAKDCADCETKQGKIDQIEREIELAGPLDEEQKGRLLEIADKCPVHRTLHSETSVRTRLKENN